VSPKQLVPQLADQGLYLASESTMYRLQRRYQLRRQRRQLARTHVSRARTIHRATAPNQVWSWDITWLPTTLRGQYLRLYLVMDVWSRRIVGWRVAERECATLAAELITRACREGNVEPRGLVLHSDNGAPMRGSAMVSTLQWLGIVPSFSRPHVSDDNPYSQALFRTLEYTPAYPSMPFADVASAERWVSRFVVWYNSEHRHSAIRFVTPDERHHAWSEPSSSAAAISTSECANQTQSAGLVPRATGLQSESSLSTQNDSVNSCCMTTRQLP
jgi:transposase InsO family protein